MIFPEKHIRKSEHFPAKQLTLKKKTAMVNTIAPNYAQQGKDFPCVKAV